MSMCIMMMEIKKKKRNEDTMVYLGNFCAIIGMISIRPATNPIIMDNNNVFICLICLKSFIAGKCTRIIRALPTLHAIAQIGLEQKEMAMKCY